MQLSEIILLRRCQVNVCRLYVNGATVLIRLHNTVHSVVVSILKMKATQLISHCDGYETNRYVKWNTFAE